MPDVRDVSPDYGLDAPGVVRNLFVAGGVCLAGGVTALLHLWPGQFTIQLAGEAVRFDLLPGLLVAGLAMTFTGSWMAWSSRVGKLREREQLLDRIAWRGDEAVLDVGCGRGLLLVGAAKRLRSGHATGIDLWRAEDLAGNRPEATLENARREGVAERVSVKTGDMRKLPFEDGTFDVVVSRAAVHNLPSAEDRATAIAEVARVLKPGGQAVIEDVRHIGHYLVAFERAGCAPVERIGSRAVAWLTTLLTLGSLRPGTLRAVKRSGPVSGRQEG